MSRRIVIHNHIPAQKKTTRDKDRPEGQRVKIKGGMSEFIGKTGTITGKEGNQYRVRLDSSVTIPWVGEVSDDLWDSNMLQNLDAGKGKARDAGAAEWNAKATQFEAEAKKAEQRGDKEAARKWRTSAEEAKRIAAYPDAKDASYSGGGIKYIVAPLPKNYNQDKGSWCVRLGSPDGPFVSIHKSEAEADTAARESAKEQDEHMKRPASERLQIRMPERDRKTKDESTREAQAKAEKLQAIDNRIWDKFGFKSGGEVQRNWDKYKAAVAAAVPESNFSVNVYEALEDENFHSMIKALMELGKLRTSDAAAKPPFETWMRNVDKYAYAIAGVSIHDLSDMPYRDWYDGGVNERSAANRAIKRSKAGDASTPEGRAAKADEKAYWRKMENRPEGESVAEATKRLGPAPIGSKDAPSKEDLAAFHEFEHGTKQSGGGHVPTYRHKTSGKEIASTQSPGSEWERVGDRHTKDGFVLYSPNQFGQWKAKAEQMGDRVVEMMDDSPNEPAGSGPWRAFTKSGGLSGEFDKRKGGHLQQTADKAPVLPARLSGPKPVVR